MSEEGEEKRKTSGVSLKDTWTFLFVVDDSIYSTIAARVAVMEIVIIQNINPPFMTHSTGMWRHICCNVTEETLDDAVREENAARTLQRQLPEAAILYLSHLL